MAKVLLIAPTCNGQDVGEAWVAFQWAQRLGKRHDVTLLTYHKRGAKTAAEQLPGIEVVEWTEPPILGRAERLNSLLKPGYVPFYVRARKWIRRSLKAGRHFDIAHQPVPVAMRYPSPAANLGIPLIIGPVGGGLSTPRGFASEDETAPWFTKLRELDRFRLQWDPMLRNSFQSAACVLGIADYVKEQLEGVPLQLFKVMSETGLDDVPHPIDRSGRDAPVNLLFVGRLVRTKGVRDLIHAMTMITDLQVRLDVVGEGPERAECEALIARFGLEQRVLLHGWRSKAEVSEFYRNADVFVFPSYREPGGNVALEAMGYSLPLIVVDRGGPGSAVTDSCAIKVSVSTPDALARDVAASIRLLVEEPTRRRQMGKAARMHVLDTARWEQKLNRIDALYASITDVSHANEAGKFHPSAI